MAIGIFGLAMASCASIPKEIIGMSSRLDRQLYALESANTALIYKVFQDKEDAAIIYLDSIWFPEFLKAYFGKESVQELWRYAVNSDNMTDRIEVTSFLTKKAVDRYKEEREVLLTPIAAERDSIVAAYSAEYEKARRMNDALGRLLESQYEVKKAYGQFLPDGKAEELDSMVSESLGRLDTSIRRIENGASIVNGYLSSLRDSLTNLNKK